MRIGRQPSARIGRISEEPLLYDHSSGEKGWQQASRTKTFFRAHAKRRGPLRIFTPVELPAY
jgi:hypothetical protein